MTPNIRQRDLCICSRPANVQGVVSCFRFKSKIPACHCCVKMTGRTFVFIGLHRTKSWVIEKVGSELKSKWTSSHKGFNDWNRFVSEGSGPRWPSVTRVRPACTVITIKPSGVIPDKDLYSKAEMRGCTILMVIHTTNTRQRCEAVAGWYCKHCTPSPGSLPSLVSLRQCLTKTGWTRRGPW